MMQYIKRESERKIQMQTQGYASRFEPLLYVPAFTYNDFHYVHTGPSTKGTSTDELQLQLGVHNSTLFLLYTRGREKAQYKAKKEIQLGDHKYYKQSLGNLKISQTKPLIIHDPRGKILNEKFKYVSAQSFWKRKHKENTWEKLLDRYKKNEEQN